MFRKKRRRFIRRPRRRFRFRFGRRRSAIVKHVAAASRGRSFRPSVYDSNLNNATIGNAGTVLLMNNIAQGTGYDNRQQQSVSMQSVTISASVYTGASSTNVESAFRCMVVLDKQQSASAVFLGVGGINTESLLLNTQSTDPMVFLRNPTTFDRYVVLYDKSFSVLPYVQAAGAPTIIGGGTPPVHFIKKKIKLRNTRVDFDNTAGAITAANICSNSLWLFFICGTNTANNTLITFANSRLRFKV